MPAMELLPLQRDSNTPKASTLGSLPTLSSSAEAMSHAHYVVEASGAIATLRQAGVTESMIQSIDDATVGRFDLYSQVLPGGAIDLYTRGGALLGCRTDTIIGPIWAIYHDGAVSQPGWYDEKGRSLAGPLRSRPLALSRVTSGFGQRMHPISGKEKRHTGVDYGAAIGTPVYAVGAGDVRETGFSDSAGNYIKLAHDGGFESWYLHLNDVAVKTGQAMKQGELVAHTGNTGASTGPHLHFEIRIANIPLDPQRTVPVPTLALSPRAQPAHQAMLQRMKETP